MEPFSTLRTQRAEWNRTWMERLEKERTRTERNVDGTIGKRTNENGTERGWNGWKNNARERNDLNGGPPFITERNDLEKSWSPI